MFASKLFYLLALVYTSSVSNELVCVAPRRTRAVRASRARLRVRLRLATSSRACTPRLMLVKLAPVYHARRDVSHNDKTHAYVNLR
jgi:hypothetical protein